MFRLLGILTLSELLLGGRHRRHSMGRGLLLGALLGYLANRDFDMDRVKRDAGKAAKEARKTAHAFGVGVCRNMEDTASSMVVLYRTRTAETQSRLSRTARERTLHR